MVIGVIHPEEGYLCEYNCKPYFFSYREFEALKEDMPEWKLFKVKVDTSDINKISRHFIIDIIEKRFGYREMFIGEKEIRNLINECQIVQLDV